MPFETGTVATLLDRLLLLYLGADMVEGENSHLTQGLTNPCSKTPSNKHTHTQTHTHTHRSQQTHTYRGQETDTQQHLVIDAHTDTQTNKGVC